jgi:serine-type D-Ala-D-Ala carboxypeptidase (penicillin-binding protein 5/6)
MDTEHHMHKIALLFSFAGIIVFGLLAAGAMILFSGNTVFAGISLFSGPDERFQERVAGVSVGIDGPIIEEQRSIASEFRPIRRDDAGIFAVPTAHAAILLDAATEIPLYEKDADERRSIASITKLFTAMIVVEETGNLGELVTIDEETVYAEGTRVGCPRSGYCPGVRLQIGERIAVQELLKAALMNSANDAAIALAKHVSGSQERFAEKMNARAKELGLTNSHFCTPSGLELDGYEEECYSTARDIAKIAIAALEYDILWRIMLLEKTNIVSADGKYVHEIFNTNELLGQYPTLVGTKTGFTPRAGYSLLAVAEDPYEEKHRLIAVVLDDTYRWRSIQNMFSWGFDAFEWR